MTDFLLDHSGPSGTSTLDYEALRKGTILERFGNLNPVPVDDVKTGREGFLYEKFQTADFTKRLYSIRDSFLLCYDSQDVDPASPRYAINLGLSRVSGSCPKQVTLPSEIYGGDEEGVYEEGGTVLMKEDAEK